MLWVLSEHRDHPESIDDVEEGRSVAGMQGTFVHPVIVAGATWSQLQPEGVETPKLEVRDPEPEAGQEGLGIKGVRIGGGRRG